MHHETITVTATAVMLIRLKPYSLLCQRPYSLLCQCLACADREPAMDKDREQAMDKASGPPPSIIDSLIGLYSYFQYVVRFSCLDMKITPWFDTARHRAQAHMSSQLLPVVDPAFRNMPPRLPNQQSPAKISKPKSPKSSATPTKRPGDGRDGASPGSGAANTRRRLSSKSTPSDPDLPNLQSDQHAASASAGDLLAAAPADNQNQAEIEAILGPSGPHQGLLVGKNPATFKPDFDIFDESLDIDQLFSPLKGADLLEACVLWYLDKEESQPFWYTDTAGKTYRAIIRSPQSRPIQMATVASYMPRMQNEGLSLMTGSGEIVFKWSNPEHEYPIECGSGNHRCETYYANEDSCPGNPRIMGLRANGIQPRVKKLKWNMPPKIWQMVIQMLNRHGAASGHNHIDFLEEASALEADWKLKASRTWLGADHPRYQEFREKYILSRASSSAYLGFYTKWEHFKSSLALCNMMLQYGFWERHKRWSHSSVDYLSNLRAA